jgi:endonuclease/exonuclease/phosphatase family metal-dependent hydrolase
MKLLNRKNKAKIGLVNRIILAINLVFVLFLALSYLSPFISPAKTWVFAFFGLGYFYLLILNIIFVLYWLIVKRKYALYSAIIIILGFNHILTHFQQNKTNIFSSEQEYFSVMSYNVRLFDLYNWSNNTTTRDNMINFIAEKDPDIFCFQEYFDADDDYFPVKKPLLEKVSAKYVHEDFFTTKANGSMRFGIATYSRFPIVNKGSLYFSDSISMGNYAIYTDILFQSDTIRIYNTHLSSLHFSVEDYKLVDNELEPQTDIKIGFKQIARKLRDAYIKRAEQVEILVKHIDESPHQVVLCGDFNDTPVSYTYRTVKKKLKDSFCEAGKGLGNTYIAKFLRFRIDYIFHSENLEASNFRVIKQTFTDHYPIICDICIKEEE